MADENATTTTNATPTPARIPSPAAFAKKAPAAHVAAKASYSQEDLTKAESFGRVDDQGTVFLKEGEGEREIGQFPNVPKAEALELYARRFLDLKARFELFADRLTQANVKSHEIDETLQQLTQALDKPAMLGDIAELKQRLETLNTQAAEKKASLAQARHAAVEHAIATRTAIVEKAEALAQALSSDTNWRSTSDKFRNLFDNWQEAQHKEARIDHAQADVLWKRFSAARTTFNRARNAWNDQRTKARAEAKRLKEAIIAEATALENSTEWAETSRKFNDLMARWKQAGQAGRNEDEALWTQFRQAADQFFNARQADREQTSSTEQENLKLKEALLEKAEALLPVHTEAEAKKARHALAQIQEQWDAIGYVPRDDMHRIEHRLDAVDKQIKVVEDAAWKQTDPETNARKSAFEEQLTAQLQELDARISTTDDPAKKAALEAEKATKEQWLHAVK